MYNLVMPRQPRFLPPGNFYHIMARGNNRDDVFSRKEDYQYYLKKFAELKQEHPFDLYHYCLMTNHIHLAIKTNNETSFSMFMKRLNLTYYHYFHRHYGFSGYFWQGRFKSQLINSDPYFIQCGKYIELNPVRANLVDNPEDYLWSSYCFYAEDKANRILTPDIFYEELGQDNEERKKNYQKLVVGDIVADILHQKKEPIGPKRFVNKTKRRLNYHIKHKDAPYRQR